ncbi:MAG: NAD-dependent epimerase/dehydratase family protein [Planctomycetia bacterium]|nr:NAD-dependent epimerase/dehydratase family protein [Planctomycetia bacterium]
MQAIHTAEDLETELSRPTPGAIEALRGLQGDVLVLGAGGKMGPTLARMVRRGLDTIGHTSRRVIAVSRFSSAAAAAGLRNHGVETIACDLLDRDAVASLPDAANVIFMAGQKFGTSDAPELTWVMNTLVPANVADRYRHSRTVVFSTGCVYPLAAVGSRGSHEDDPLGPPGDYANSCVGRERVFEYFAKLHGTPAVMYRLSYAIDLRYGVLCDVATKVARGLPVDVTMPAANVIWQGDANARAIQCLTRAASPPAAVNVTGLEPISIHWLASQFGERLGREPLITGSESSIAWLFDAQRSYDWFGPPTVGIDDMIDAQADWVRRGGETLGKPTHFEVRDGQF